MKKIIYSAALIALAVMSSCKREYLDAGDNPNNPTVSDALLVLPNALNVTAGRLPHNEIGAFWGGHWSPTTSVTGFTEEKTYNAQASFSTAGNVWVSCYNNIKDYDFVEKDAADKKLKTLQGIAQVMKVYNFQLLADAYGDIPYSEALQGETGNTSPAYDSAKDKVYPGLIKDLDVALANLAIPTSVTNTPPNKEDIYFAGDRIKWMRFANTLKLRILMRQSYVADKDAYVKAQILAIKDPTSSGALGGQIFLGIYEDVTSSPGYLKTSGKQNQFWNNYGFTEADANAARQQFFGISEYARQQIEGATTTTGGVPPRDFQRLVRIAKPVKVAATATFKYVFTGIPFGAQASTFGYPVISSFGVGFLRSYDQKMVVMTASEALMLQAEAVQRGYMAGNFKTLFRDAVRSSFALLRAGNAPLTGPRTSPAGNYTDWEGINEDLNYDALTLPSKDIVNFDATQAEAEKAADNYMNYSENAGTVADINGPNPLKTIMEQKWICMIGFSGFEAWCDVRRYQNVDGSVSPILNIPVSVSTTSAASQRPLRLPYPTVEQQFNNVNLNAAIAAQPGLTTVVSKGIFWDIK